MKGVRLPADWWEPKTTQFVRFARKQNSLTELGTSAFIASFAHALVVEDGPLARIKIFGHARYVKNGNLYWRKLENGLIWDRNQNLEQANPAQHILKPTLLENHYPAKLLIAVQFQIPSQGL